MGSERPVVSGPLKKQSRHQDENSPGATGEDERVKITPTN